MNTNALIYRIIQGLRSFSISDDSRITKEYIYSLILTYRAKLIRQEKSAGKSLTGYYISNLGEVEMQKADKHECATISECVLRTVNPIPKALDTNGNNLILFVGTLDGHKPYERCTYNTIEHMTRSRFTGSFPKWYELQSHIYVINAPKLLKVINIQMVAEDPREANSYKTCGNTVDAFDDLNFEFPVSQTIVDSIIKLVVDEVRGVRLTPQDTVNNTKDDGL